MAHLQAIQCPPSRRLTHHACSEEAMEGRISDPVAGGDHPTHAAHHSCGLQLILLWRYRLHLSGTILYRPYSSTIRSPTTQCCHHFDFDIRPIYPRQRPMDSETTGPNRILDLVSAHVRLRCLARSQCYRVGQDRPCHRARLGFAIMG